MPWKAWEVYQNYELVALHYAIGIQFSELCSKLLECFLAAGGQVERAVFAPC